MGTQQKPHIIGIGASAGGLEAITQLIAHLKPDLPCAYVVLQHLSPTYRSMMVDILSRETSLKVREVTDGEHPQAATIYVVPANSNAVLKEGRLRLVAAPPEIVPKPSINQFLISLAAEEEESSIGIVLSGTGSDGVAGLRTIQAAGGITFAQSPETAKYDGMPRAAIDAGVADNILPPEAIAQRIPELLAMPQPSPELTQPDLVNQLIERLRERLKFDFSGYKIGTLMRRIRRREVATGSQDLAAYLGYIESNPQELEFLARDILISVTAFFRDKEAFETLARLIQTICQHKQPGGEIRIWVAGCASGEEAYSIAMLVAEALGDRLVQYRVQIFATDIDEEALNVARRGVYPAAAMAEVSGELLERYFHPQNNSYEASKALRDMIVFARHNLVSDPPFLRLDLVSCRNVLIYFDTALQSKVLQTFHFGLQRDGHLFLGRSESVAQADQLFSAIDRRERLFRKAGDNVVHAPTVLAPIRIPGQRQDRKIELLLSALVSHFDAAAILCDQEGNILHSAGSVERYLQFPSGSVRLSVTEIATAKLRGELLAMFHRVRVTNQGQRSRQRKIGDALIRMYVEPVGDFGRSTMLLALFQPDRKEEETARTQEQIKEVSTRDVEDELLVTREHLQALVEEMATANEEMQALNEEAQAANEELQATNEELEAANEELQATNEELISLNEELSVKTTELANLTEEYAHLYDALQFPILVFDRSSQLIRFNAPAQRCFSLRQTALKQHISRLKLGRALDSLEVLMGRALAHADREELTVEQDNRVYRLSVIPGLNKFGESITLVVTLIDITDLTLAHSQLEESQSRLSALMANTTVIFAMKDLSGNYVYANRRFLEFFKIENQAYVGKNDFMLLPSNVAADLWGLDLTALRERKLVTGEHLLDLGGKTFHLRSTHQILTNSNGVPTALIMEAEDITASAQAEEQLRITARVFDQAGEAIAITDPKGNVQTVNSAFTRITGYDLHEVKNRPISILKSGRQSHDFYQAMWLSLNDTGFWQGEIWNKRKNGEVYPEWLTINRIDAPDGTIEHYIAVFTDITLIKDSQRKAEYLATHDPLTGLPNRALFHDRLRHALAQARRNKDRIALLFIDLDNFKTINDTLGHDIGDDLLKQAATRLREVVRDVDTVARLGGDEFTAILTESSSEIAEQVARRISDELAASFNIEQRTHFVSASIGIAFYPDDGQDSSSLVKAADAAMYRAKEKGRNCIEYFKPDLQVKLHKRAAIESALREALRSDRLRLVYQPKFDLRKRQTIIGAEALLRWSDPELGNVSPAEFIPIAESSGLILDVNRVVVKLLLGQLGVWQKLAVTCPPIALNVSPRCMQESGFADSILKELVKTSIAPAMLHIEITEGALLENSGTVTSNLDTLNKEGIKIAIDDFGTGYSSLGYLKRLPLAELKIDKSFVDGLGQDHEDEAIALAILGLGKAMGLRTIAEGIETERQYAWLAEHECDYGQGYLLAKPLEAEDFEDLLARSEHRD
ncbi:EAL domain-containing protein [Azonexus sp. IMCC34839]|uniref:EAL domain-containing protein n=1 Tax=Azonexus sp. IMCC34839 TaxID=3133695 RepID=UPI00399BA6CE